MNKLSDCMTDSKRKRSIIYLSSSSSSSTDEEEEEEEEEGESESEEENGDDQDEEISGDAIVCSEDEEEEENESDSVDEEIKADEDEAFCKKVICLLREGKDLEALSLKECKAYLRKHGLRLAGNKAVCIHRIKEHWRLKDGNGELLYPRSSFIINCKGDVCKGDVVVFTQKVYEKFDKVSRHGNVLGTRTVAGRVVKESYGSAKQQHTFTVEVLWSRGIKKLRPLFPLLVKGRNLYKLKTLRQPWNNEAERVRVLAEKHNRGAAARLVRAMKRPKIKQPANGCRNDGVKDRKRSNYKRPSQTRNTAELLKTKHGYGHKKDTLLQRESVNNHQQEAPPSSRQLNLKRNVRSHVVSLPNWRHANHRYLNMDMDPTLHSYAYTGQDPFPRRIEFHHHRVPFQFPCHDTGSTSTMVRLPRLQPYADTALQHQGLNHWNGIHGYRSNHG